MKKKNRRHAGWKLLLLVLAVLFPAAAPAVTAGAFERPASGTLTIHNYVLEDMDAAGIPNDGNETTGIPADAKPLADAEFTIWQVDPAVVSAVSSLSASEAWSAILPAAAQSGVTNASGTVSFHLDSGLYYVAETGNYGEEKVVFCEPFLVSVPMADPGGSGWITDVHVYPKNQSAVIDKFVADTGITDYDQVNKHLPVAAGERFNWYIRSPLPIHIGTAYNESYVITDALNSCFDYQPGTVKVYIMPAGDSNLKNSTVLGTGDYNVRFNTASNTLTVELTASGFAAVKNLAAAGNRYSVVEYSCAVNDTAPQGVALYSGAKLEYTADTTAAGAASYGSGGIETTNLPAVTDSLRTVSMSGSTGSTNTLTAEVAMQPEVHVGEIEITKLADGTKKLLSGARFGLAETKADARAGNFLATDTTDTEGRLTFRGLKYGQPGDKPGENTGNTTYWLMETRAPAGYRLVKDPVEVVFNYQQDKETGEYYFAKVNVYNVLNKTPAAKDNTGDNVNPVIKTASVIKTGDTGGLYLLTASMLLSLAAIAAVIVYRNKKKVSGEKK